MAATIDTWLVGSGDWSDAANWSQGVPGPTNSASFGTNPGISASFTATGTIDQLLDPANPGATLVLNQGLLSVLDGGTWDGVFVVAPGAELDAHGQPLVLSGVAALDGIIGGDGTVSVTGSADAQRLTLDRLGGSAGDRHHRRRRLAHPRNLVVRRRHAGGRGRRHVRHPRRLRHRRGGAGGHRQRRAVRQARRERHELR